MTNKNTQQEKKIEPRPWYKEPWPWILASGPAIVVVAGFVTFYLAAHTDDTLVSDDYYKEGKNIIKQMDRDEEAANRHLSAKLVFNKKLDSARIIISNPEYQSDQMTLTIQHPTLEKKDQHIQLTLVNKNMYQAQIAALTDDKTKYWYLTLEDEQKQWRLQSKWDPNILEVDLEPALSESKKNEQKTT